MAASKGRVLPKPAALSMLMLLVCANAFASSHQSQSLTVDLPQPYLEVLAAVHEVAANGLVSGSAEYEKESAISGAQTGDQAPPFGAWTGPGQALYKTRAGVLSPSHFIGSNDSGALSVRYVVQPVHPALTRLIIDAVFVEGTHHRRHPSDGTVETAELAQVQQRIRVREEQQSRAKQQQEREEVMRLEEEAGKEKRELDRVLGEVSELEQHVQALRRQVVARVRSAAQLKAEPFGHASSVCALNQGELVRVLISTPHWFRVRDGEGREGWLPHLALEALP
jgi:Bacterial SH3 domain